jgi:multimeric flavodoxin WrbA
MKKIMALNGSPRSGWNTDILVREAAQGAKSRGAEVEVIELYKLDPFTGCQSCFACKTPKSLSRCAYRDGLSPVLDKIRSADGLILGTPIYIGEATAGFRALYERLIFQYATYKIEPKSYNDRRIPVLLIFTSNIPEDNYSQVGYDRMIDAYKSTTDRILGPVQCLISSDTLQVSDYRKYDWTMFDPEKKKARRENVFPTEKKTAFNLGAGMISQI